MIVAGQLQLCTSTSVGWQYRYMFSENRNHPTCAVFGDKAVQYMKRAGGTSAATNSLCCFTSVFPADATAAVGPSFRPFRDFSVSAASLPPHWLIVSDQCDEEGLWSRMTAVRATGGGNPHALAASGES